jgi:hypothetical protein
MADELSPDERDARSLEIQAQWESEARRVAWEQTYGRKRKKKIPMRGDSDQRLTPLTNVGATADANSPATNATTIDTWAGFESISLSAWNSFSGVYGILHRASARIYVGSSVNVIERLRKHVSDLEGDRHHSLKLQNAFTKYGRHQFEFLLVEKVADVINLRVREQHWIDQLCAYARGFNSKSQADGPELSLATHIENAKHIHLPAIYARLEPERQDFTPNVLDKEGFRSDLKPTLIRKFKQVTITALLVWTGVEFPSFRFLWLAIMFYFGPVILFDWPDTPKKRAEGRYFEAEANARKEADIQLIRFIADRLGMPSERVAQAYPDAERTIARRMERSDRYRRRNAELKRWRSGS